MDFLGQPIAAGLVRPGEMPTRRTWHLVPSGRAWSRRLVRILTAYLIALFSVSLAAENVQSPTTPGAAATASRAALTAAYLFNFAKFVEWPADALAPGATLVMCVGDPEVAVLLADAVRGKSIDGHAIEVREAALDQRLRTCHVLYVTGLEEKATAQLVEKVRGASTLAVSDREQFTKTGGVAHFFVQGGHMRFAINVQAAERAGLRISSRLLGLATIINSP